jgi:hypothetical protein
MRGRRRSMLGTLLLSTATVVMLEGVLDSVGVGGVARGKAFECKPTLS